MKAIKNFFEEFGSYLLLMKEAFRKPQNMHVFYRKLLFEMRVLGLDSILIVTIISVFVGAAVVIQLLLNLENPIYPDWVYGYSSRKAIMLEFSPTIISLILAGKCASRIASELGSQRISEQIDALEVMGVNTASYLILPKIIASMIFFPLLIILSIFIALLGGAFGVWALGSLTMNAYIEGLRLEYQDIDMIFAIVKTFVNAIIISTIASYRGYTLKGGSVEVGIQSTKAVVQSSIVIMIFDLILTNLFM
ncbi:MAG: ABC transporter permease [Bacteroidales bacterium]|nr:ABC transporter permease [Bacteroidales bacterium]MEE0992459.1 ABC transporter permease [Bacteroidales bacterium]